MGTSVVSPWIDSTAGAPMIPVLFFGKFPRLFSRPHLLFFDLPSFPCPSSHLDCCTNLLLHAGDFVYPVFSLSWAWKGVISGCFLFVPFLFFFQTKWFPRFFPRLTSVLSFPFAFLSPREFLFNQGVSEFFFFFHSPPRFVKKSLSDT